MRPGDPGEPGARCRAGAGSRERERSPSAVPRRAGDRARKGRIPLWRAGGSGRKPLIYSPRAGGRARSFSLPGAGPVQRDGGAGRSRDPERGICRPAEQSVPGREAALRPQGGRAGQREPGQERPAPQGSEQFAPGAREAGGGAALGAGAMSIAAREIRVSQGPLPGRGGEPGEGKKPFRRPPEGRGQGAKGRIPLWRAGGSGRKPLIYSPRAGGRARSFSLPRSWPCAKRWRSRAFPGSGAGNLPAQRSSLSRGGRPPSAPRGGGPDRGSRGRSTLRPREVNSSPPAPGKRAAGRSGAGRFPPFGP